MQTPDIWKFPKHQRGEYIFFTPGRDQDSVYDNLPNPPELNPENNPYRGLKPFEKEHTHLFFGRQELIQQLFTQVSRFHQQFTVVLGISGSGKSSLVKAGLIPKLEQNEINLIEGCLLSLAILEVLPYFPIQYLPISYTYQWKILETIRPTSNPFQEFVRAFQPLINISIKELKNNPRNLINGINQWAKQKPHHKLLLFIDQFEELITQATKTSFHKEEKQDSWLDKAKNIFQSNKSEEIISESIKEVQPEWEIFLNFLANILQNCPQLSIVVTLRSDFEPRFAESILNPYWHRFLVRPMRRDELREVVETPAAENALYFEPANLIDRLVDEVYQMPGALPLLSFTLSELYVDLYDKWKGNEKSDRSLTVDQEFEKQGGVAGSLTRRMNEEYQQIGKPDFKSKRLIFTGLFDDKCSNPLLINTLLFEQEIEKLYQVTMRRIMLRMVEIEGGETVKKRVLESELTYSSDLENKRVKTVLDCLVKNRLIVTGKDISGKPYYEPAHDFLVRGWEQLQNWIKEYQEDLTLKERLTPAANDWENVKENYQPKSILDKTEPVINVIDKVCLVIENSLVKFPNFLWQRLGRSQSQESSLKEKPMQFLWHTNPYLDVLNREINTEDNWLNRIEKQFVKESILKKRRDDSWFQRFVSIFILGLSGLTIIAFIQRRNAELNRADSLAQTALTSWNEGFKNLDSLISAIKATKLMKKYNVNKPIVIDALYKTLSQTWELNNLKGHDNAVTSFSISPNNQILASGSYDDTIKLWNINTGKKICTITGHSDSIYSVSFSFDGKILASASSNSSVPFDNDFLRNDDNSIKIWDSNTCQEIMTLTGHEKDDAFSSAVVNSVSFNPHNNHNNVPILASGSTDKTIKLWNTQTGEVICTLTGHNDSVHSVNFSPDGKMLVSGSSDRTIKLWNTQNLENCQSIQQGVRTLNGHNESVNSVSFSLDGKMLVSGSGQLGGSKSNSIIKLWNLETLEEIHTFEGHTSLVNSVSFSPNGEILASGSHDQTIKLWDINTKNEIQTLKGHNYTVTSVGFIEDRNNPILISTSGDRTIRFWNPNTIKKIETIDGHDNSVDNIIFSPNNPILASASRDNTIKLWNIETGKIIHTLEHEGVKSIRFNPDGNILASGSTNVINLWNVSTGAKIHNLEHPYVNNIIFDPNKKILASQGMHNIKLWNIETGEIIHDLTHGRVNSIRFSQNGDKQILISEGYYHIKFWDVETGQEINNSQEDNKIFNYDTNNSILSRNGKILAFKNFYCRTATINRPRTDISSLTFQDKVCDRSGDFDTLSIRFERFIQKIDNDFITFWQINQDKTITEIHSPKTECNNFTFLGFSKDDRILVSQCPGKDTIELWNTQTGQKVYILKHDRVKQIYFTEYEDKKILASVSLNNTIKIWDLKTGKVIKVIEGFDSFISNISFNFDGQILAIGYSNGNINLRHRLLGWGLDDLMKQSCDRIRNYLIYNNSTLSQEDKKLCKDITKK